MIKNYLLLCVLLFFVSCNSNDDVQQLTSVSVEALNVTRSGGNSYEFVEMIETDNSDQSEDVLTVMNLQQSLMSAEKENTMTDVTLNTSSESIQDGVFLFNLDSENAKDLTFEIYDEEGFSLHGSNTFTIYGGKNYKAIRLTSFDKGSYIFRLRDEQGREINQTIVVE